MCHLNVFRFVSTLLVKIEVCCILYIVSVYCFLSASSFPLLLAYACPLCTVDINIFVAFISGIIKTFRFVFFLYSYFFLSLVNLLSSENYTTFSLCLFGHFCGIAT